MAERARRILAGLGVALLVGCSSLPVVGGVLQGAKTVLDAVCETRPHLDFLTLAQSYLEDCDKPAAEQQDCDVPAAIAALKAHLVQYGHDPDVSALITLLEGQLPKDAASHPAGVIFD